MNVAALFAGCGGLDLGFQQAGFHIVWANEYDKKIWSTYELNHPCVHLDRRSIADIQPDDIPDVDGFIGGPPCQSWSLAGEGRGANDKRGQLFFEYIRLLEAKKPLFFLAENVKGIISSRHIKSFGAIEARFRESGYTIASKLVNTKYFGTPQDRERVILVGIRSDLDLKMCFPNGEHGEGMEIGSPLLPYITLRQAIGDLGEPVPAITHNKHNPEAVNNHEYMTGGFSYIYMSRNRIRKWDEVSFTIQASGRHAMLHPSCPPMQSAGKDKKVFSDDPSKYRRLSIRECARIQDFPDDFKFEYSYLNDGYKMIGNAVPVKLARAFAESFARMFSRTS